ncbi:MAG: tetratricopeptide repeat protein [Phycisphaeraceae bacterium]|nr:tetratricopeptide repeat protein [Phycisphaeraceae bacterium]
MTPGNFNLYHRAFTRIVLAGTAAALTGCSSGGGSASGPATNQSEASTSGPITDIPDSGPKTRDAIALASLQRAEALAKSGMTRPALVEFERAIENNPSLPQAYIGAAEIYRGQGDYESASVRYRQAADLMPQNFEPRYNEGLMLQLLHRLTEAVRAYLKALEIKPNDFDANLNIATAYLEMNEPGSGLPYAQRAVQINPRSGPAHANLGSIYGALNRHQDAVNEYRQALEQVELSPPLLLNLANSLGKVGRYDEMVNTLNQVIKIQPSAAAYERMGYAEFKLYKYDEALKYFRTSVEIDPNYAPGHTGVGVCLLNEYEFSKRQNDSLRSEALSHLRTSVQLDPRQTQVIDIINRYR